MKSTALLGLFTASAIALAGCNNKPDETARKDTGATTIAVVDFDQLYKQMNWTDQMKANLDQTQASVSKKLTEYLEFRKKELEKRRDEIANTANHGSLSTAEKDQLKKVTTRAEMEALHLTPAQMDELTQLMNTVVAETERANAGLNQILQNQRQKIVQTFLTAAGPSIRRVARMNNRQVIVDAASAFYFDKSNDLTEQVQEELQKSTAKIDLPPVPNLEFNLPAASK